MSLSAPPPAGKKLGLLLSCPPHHPNFKHALNLAETALNRGLQVYLYCIDEAVMGLHNARLKALTTQQLRIFACAAAARRHSVPIDECAIFGGLGSLSDILSATDRFLSFNS